MANVLYGRNLVGHCGTCIAADLHLLTSWKIQVVNSDIMWLHDAMTAVGRGAAWPSLQVRGSWIFP